MTIRRPLTLAWLSTAVAVSCFTLSTFVLTSFTALAASCWPLSNVLLTLSTFSEAITCAAAAFSEAAASTSFFFLSKRLPALSPKFLSDAEDEGEC